MDGKIASLLEVGTGFHPEMTGRENVFLNGAILGMTREEIVRKFDDIVDYSGVSAFIDTPVKRYSSGMYIRLAFSVAVHLDSDIIILDEVLAVGDAQFQKKCLQTMESLSRDSGRTVLFVSHAANSVRKLCQRCLWLDHGRMAAIGNASEIMNEYAGGDEDMNRYRVDWEDPEAAPQNSVFRLAACYITDNRLEPTTKISTDDDFCICCEYVAKIPDARIGLSFVFFDLMGNEVFSSINNHDRDYGKPLTNGKRYRSVCRIPGGLLNSGRFSMGISYFMHGYADAHFTKPILFFEIMDGAALRADYPGKYDGIFRPTFDWQTDAL